VGQHGPGLSANALQAALCVAGVACCVAMAMPQVHIVAYCGDLGYGVARGAEMLSLMLGFGIFSRIASGLITPAARSLRMPPSRPPHPRRRQQQRPPGGVPSVRKTKKPRPEGVGLSNREACSLSGRCGPSMTQGRPAAGRLVKERAPPERGLEPDELTATHRLAFGSKHPRDVVSCAKTTPRLKPYLPA
jgi:hypothetical protein